MKTIRTDPVIDAIATYICIRGIRQGIFLPEVPIDEFSAMLLADAEQKRKALQRAWEMLPQIERMGYRYG